MSLTEEEGGPRDIVLFNLANLKLEIAQVFHELFLDEYNRTLRIVWFPVVSLPVVVLRASRYWITGESTHTSI